MGWARVSESFCNIARSLSVVGDRWTLLIMREISMRNRRFEEIQAQTGMSSHLLANRLKRLEEDKIVERRVYSARPLRHEYFTTPKGKDLDGVILALRNWDLRWGGSDGKGSAAVNLTDKTTGKVIDGSWHKSEDGSFSFSDTNSVMSEEWKAEREANAAAFYAGKQTKSRKPARVKAKPAGAKSARVRGAAARASNGGSPARKRAKKRAS